MKSLVTVLHIDGYLHSKIYIMRKNVFLVQTPSVASFTDINPSKPANYTMTKSIQIQVKKRASLKETISLLSCNEDAPSLSKQRGLNTVLPTAAKNLVSRSHLTREFPW